MTKNQYLNQSKIKKNDEYYTRYTDIEKEISKYADYLKDKIIYCNCDSENSNFVKYFIDNKDNIQYKEFIYTSNDFRDNIDVLKKCDIMITNPPFSLLREFVKTIVEYNKDFIIVAPLLSLGYVTFFDFYKSYKIKTGYNTISKFDNITRNIPCIWLTTLPVKKEKPSFTKKYNSSSYPKYDNYDAINVDRLIDIPNDYKYLMGVPITFLLTYDKNSDYTLVSTHCRAKINGKSKFQRLFIRSVNEGITIINDLRAITDA